MALPQIRAGFFLLGVSPKWRPIFGLTPDRFVTSDQPAAFFPRKTSRGEKPKHEIRLEWPKT
jgi:hypothetical protein